MAGIATLRVGRLALTLALVGLISWAVPKRRALVVGIGNYVNLAADSRAENNARAMARGLAAREFQVALSINPDADGLGRDISNFLQELTEGDIAEFYFSGHCVQDGGENYLLPAGFPLNSSEGIEFQSYSLKRLVRYLEAKKLAAGIVVLEPLAPNSAMEKRFPEPGLSTIDLRGTDMVVASATMPNRAAREVRGNDVAIYTRAWLNGMEEPGLRLDALLLRVKQQVSQATQGQQVPSESSTLVSDFAFYPKSAAGLEWDRLSTSRDTAALESFRSRYAADPLAAKAATRIRDLEWESALTAASPTGVRQFLLKYPGHAEATAWLAKADADAKDAELKAVLAAIERYRKAYESKDVAEMTVVRPGLNGPERKRLEEFMRSVRSLRYELTPESAPQIQGGTATVQCRLKVALKMAGGDPPPVDQSVTLRLRKQSDGWIIESFQ